MKNILFAVLISFAVTANAASPLPGDSVLQLSNTFTNQDAKNFKLIDRRGKPQLVAMFYTSCKFMCPLMIDSGLGVDHALTPAERNNLSVLLVSIDPARDTPEALMYIVKKRKLDTTRWTLARTDEKSVRTLAALLGIRYRVLSNGEFNHTSAMILLDADGRIVARTESLGAKPDPVFLAAVKKTITSGMH